MTGKHRANRRTRECPVCKQRVASITGSIDLADPSNRIEGHHDRAGHTCPGGGQQYGITIDPRYGRLRP